MNIKAGINFHNRFDLVVKNSVTGEIKQKGYAENIVLNQMYTRICNYSSYFVNIHFGTGSGTLDPARTSLFAHLGTRAVTTVETIKAFPTSKWVRKIVLLPAEYVDSTFTEIGIAFGATASNLVTHAMIKDSEGNPLTLTKGPLDILEIYATVFITLSDVGGQYNWIDFPANNGLINYLTGGAVPSNTLIMDMADTKGFSTAAATKTGTKVVDVNDKKVTISTRFEYNEANGERRGFGLDKVLKVVTPKTGIYDGTSLINIPIGVGNGAQTLFDIPNLDVKGLNVKIDGVFTDGYNILNKNIVEYKVQDLTSAGPYGYGVTLSSDLKTIVTANSGGMPYFSVQKLNEATGLYEKLQDLTGGGGAGYGVTLSSDLNTIVMVGGSVPYFIVQKLNESTGLYERLQDLTGIGGGGRGVTLSSDSKTIVTASNNGVPYFTVQKLNESTGLYEKLQNLTGVGPYGYGVTLSSDSKTIVTASSAAPYFTVQKLNESTGLYEKLQDLTGVGGGGRGVTLSSDLKTIVTASDNAGPYFTVQKLNESTGLYEKLQDLTGVGPYGYGVTLSSDLKTMVTASGGAPYFTVLKLNESTGLYERLQDLIGIGGSGAAVSLSGDLKTIVTASSGNVAPYFTVQRFTDRKRIIEFITPPVLGQVITADYTVDYVPKTTDYVFDLVVELQFGEGV